MADKDDILRYNTKTRLIKEIIDNWDSIKIQSLSAKDNTKKKRRQQQEDDPWVHFSSVTQSWLTLCDLIDYSTPGFPVHHQLPELTQILVHRVSNAIQPSHPLSSPSPPTFNLLQHQRLFKWVSSLHQVAKVLEFHLQHQSFQWILRTDFL